MPRDPLVACRHAAIRDQAAAGLSAAHGRREGTRDYAHCDPERRPLVLAGGPKWQAGDVAISPFDVAGCIKAQTEAIGATAPKNAACGSELLFIASPEFFDPRNRSLPIGPEEKAQLRADYAELARGANWQHEWLDEPSATAGRSPLPQKLPDRYEAVKESGSKEAADKMRDIDPERVSLWLMTVLVAASKVEGWHVACWRLDLDEKNPHFSIFIIPTYTKETKNGSALRISTRKHFGNKAQLRQLQDWIGEVCGPLGLRRGIPAYETKAWNVAPALYRSLQEKKRKVDDELAEVERRKEEIETREAYLTASEAELGDRQVELDRREADLEREAAAQHERTETLDVRESSLRARRVQVQHEVDDVRQREIALVKREKSFEKGKQSVGKRLKAMDGRMKKKEADLQAGLSVCGAILENEGTEEACQLLTAIAEYEPLPPPEKEIDELIGSWATARSTATAEVSKPPGM